MSRSHALLLLLICTVPLLAQSDGREEAIRLVAEGRELYDDRDHDGAMERAERAWAISNDGEAQGRAKLLMADVLLRQGELMEATASAMEAYELLEGTNALRPLISTLDLLNHLSYISDKFGDSERFIRMQIDACRAYGDHALLSKARTNLANIHYIKQEWDSAEVIYRALKDDPQATHRTRFGSLTNLGSLLSERGQHADAIPFLREAVELAHTMDVDDAAWAWNNLGYGLHQANAHSEAIEAFAESERLNQEGQKRLDLSIENSGFTAECYAAMGRHSEAYGTLLRVEELKEEHHRTVADERLLELEKRFETKLKEEQIARLDLENLEKAERLQLRNTQLYGSLALLLLAAALSMLFWRNYRNKRRHAEVLDGLNHELRDQKGEIEHINALLRLKVLRTQMNPHFIHNCLHAMDRLITDGRQDEAHHYTQRFAKLLRMVLDHSVKDVVGLEEEQEFLEHYLAMEGLRLGADFTFEVQVDPALIEADAGIPALLVQPFVENAVWHGLAAKEGDKHIAVRFALAGADGVRCTITDNGVGRAEAAKSDEHRHGHKSMALALNEERVELIRHRLGRESYLRTEDLVDGEGRPAGTEVSVLLPLEMEQVQ